MEQVENLKNMKNHLRSDFLDLRNNQKHNIITGLQREMKRTTPQDFQNYQHLYQTIQKGNPHRIEKV